jgi:hypothetical protein
MEPITLTAGALVANVASNPATANMDGQGLTTSAVAGVVISHLIQPYMGMVPARLKPLVPVVAGIGSSVVACMGQGMGFKEALHYGLVTVVASLVNHRLAFAKPATTANANVNVNI